MLAGLGSAALVHGARAETPSPLAHGALASNPLAQAFEAPPLPVLPDVGLMGLDGDRDLSEFKGKTLIMPIWAEWCEPCLGELPDFGRLQEKYGNSSFAVVPILSGAAKKMTPEIVKQLFGYLHAGALTPLVEAHFGDKLWRAMARTPAGWAIPCNLVVAPSGRVIGREIGLKADTPNGVVAPSAAKMPDGSTPTLATRAESGESLSLWGKVAGEQLAQALSAGFLAQA